MSQQPLVGQDLLIIHASRSHSVELLWASDQPVAETSPDNIQHTQQTNINASRGISIRNPSNRAATDLRFRTPGLWDR
jgi:hypothetical protein